MKLHARTEGWYETLDMLAKHLLPAQRPTKILAVLHFHNINHSCGVKFIPSSPLVYMETEWERVKKHFVLVSRPFVL